MYKRVDAPDESLEGFSYVNENGHVEKVVMQHCTVKIVPSGSGQEVYYGDIPNLILALQAAYDYNKAK